MKMKYFARYIFITLILFTLLLPQAALANVNVQVNENGEGSSSNVSVHQEGSSQSTTCINGKCTTTGSTGKSEICHNGECKTYDGDVKYESNDASTKVIINTESEVSEVTLTPIPTKEKVIEPTITATPSITIKVEEIKKQVEEIKEEAKHLAKSQDALISQFVKNEFERIKKILDDLFQ